MQLVKSVEEMQAGIDALNLDAIKIKLLDPREGKGWSREYADQMEVAYKRFLLLSVKYPDMPTIPTSDVDAFWHYHILDTMKYADDCQNAFGFFLHHFPYLGMRGEEDAQNLQDASILTHDLYLKEFGEPMSFSKTEEGATCATCTKSLPSGIAASPNTATCATCTKSLPSGITASSNTATCATCTKSLPSGVMQKSKEIIKSDIRPTFAA